MKNSNKPSQKVAFAFRMDPEVFRAVSRIAVDEDRSLGNLVNRILKSSPEVAALIAAESKAGAAIGTVGVAQ